MQMFSLLLSTALVLPLGGASEGEDLERALAAISAEHARADLHFLASDEMAGRDTPSPGLRIAARFIAARMDRLGFTPAGDREYFADYQLMRAGLDVEACQATLTVGGEKHGLAMPADYYVHSNGIDDMDVSGEAVFVGTSTAAELEGLDLSGKWAVCLTSRDVSWRDRSAAARAAGAIGLLTLPGTDRDAERYDQNAQRMLRRLGGGRLQVREPAWPIAYLSPKHVPAVLPAGAETPLGTALPVRFADSRRISADSEVLDLENVAALWPGSDPEIGKEVIIVSAHYDHVGTNGEQIFNGADDNGSGTTGLLQIAEALQAHGPLRRSVLLLWVSGEEKGLLGSYAWTKRPTLPRGYTPVANLNIDMIGRNAPDYLMITPTQDRPEYNFIVKRFEEFAPLEGFPKLENADAYYHRSDQANFSRNLGIPVAFLFTDVHEDYHQASDTPDKIDYDKLARVCRLVVRMIASLQDDQLDS